MVRSLSTCLAIGLMALFIPLFGCGDDGGNPVVVDGGSGVDNLVDSAGELAEPDVYEDITELDPIEEVVGTERFLCQETTYSMGMGFEEYPVFNPNAEIAWPGGALQGASIGSPTPDRVIAPRSGGALIITNLTGTEVSTFQVPEVTHAAVIEAANFIIANQPAEYPARYSVKIARLRSRDEMQVSLRANASFFGLFGASASFNWDESSSVNRFLVELNQSYYTLVFERPSRASEFFAPDVTADELGPFMGPGNPPVYVSSVTYGRVFYLLIEATADATSMAASMSASFWGFFEAGGDVEHVSSLSGLAVQAFALGGDANTVLNAISDGVGSLNGLVQTLQAGGTITSAVPLSYTVRSVRSDKAVKNGVALDYSVRECVPIPADVGIVPASIDFGRVTNWDTASKELRVTNGGGSTASVAVEIGCTSFSFACACGSVLVCPEDCLTIEPEGVFSISPGQTKTFVVTMAPRGSLYGGCLGHMTSSVEITWGGETVSVPVLGQGVI